MNSKKSFLIKQLKAGWLQSWFILFQQDSFHINKTWQIFKNIFKYVSLNGLQHDDQLWIDIIKNFTKILNDEYLHQPYVWYRICYVLLLMLNSYGDECAIKYNIPINLMCDITDKYLDTANYPTDDNIQNFIKY